MVMNPARRLYVVVAALAVVALGASAALGWTVVRLGEVSEAAADLKERLTRLKQRLDESDGRPAATGSTFDWRSLVRRVERLEVPSGGPAAVATASTAATAVGPAQRLAATHAAGEPSGELPPSLPTKLLSAEPFKAGLQEMLKTSVKKTMEERRATWMKRFDDRLQAEVAAFGKSQGLQEPQVQSMASIIQDDRDQRRDLRRQVQQGEVDTAGAKKQIDALNTSTKQRIVETVGEAGYQAYQQQKQDQQQVMRSLRRF